MRTPRSAILLWSIAAASAATIVNNSPPDYQAALKSGFKEGVYNSKFAAADDFVLGSETRITGGALAGLLGMPAGPFFITSLQVNIYNLNPADPAGTGYPVPGALLETRDSAQVQLTYAEALDGGFTVPVARGLTPGPLQGAQDTVAFQLPDPILLPAGHYFFSAQVATACSGAPICANLAPLSLFGQFFWLTSPFPAGSGGSQYPAAFIGNADFGPMFWVGTAYSLGPHTLSFSLEGEAIPEPGTAWLASAALALLAFVARRRAASSQYARP